MGELYYDWNLLIKGYFDQVIPNEIFSTMKICKTKKTKIFENLNFKKLTSPVVLLGYKNEIERRKFSYPNFEAYVYHCKSLLDCRKEIASLVNESKFSQSKNVKARIRDYSTWFQNFYERIRISIGAKYMLEIDLSKFFDSIYTHSLVWALMGKDEAKEEFSKKPTERSADYKKFDKIDFTLRNLNNQETQGIVTGPISSMICSEILLCRLDKIISETFSWKGKRYVDDFKFFFKSELKAKEALSEIQNIFFNYKLNINLEKSKIKPFPFEENNDLNEKLSNFNFNQKNSIVKFLQKTNTLHANGVKGAYKYALKVLSQKKITTDYLEIEALLFNALLAHPSVSNLILKIFIQNNRVFFSKKEELQSIINDVLSDEIAYRHNQESLWLLYFLTKLNLEIRVENLIEALKNGDNFSKIIVLDYIVKKNISDPNVITEKGSLISKIQNESIYGENWLLIYEAYYNGWIRKFKHKSDAKFFNYLKNNKVNFYHSIIKNN